MKRRFPMNLQLFAEGGASGGQGDGAGSSGAAGNQPGASGTGAAGTGSSTGVQFDYEKLAGLIAGKTSVTEDTVLKSYFKQQGLSQEEMSQAIQAFKAQKAANQPDVGALQTQAAQAQAAAQQAQVQAAATMAAVGLGIDAKTIPYIIKMADLSKVTGEDGKINDESMKTALNKVLEDIPALKPQTQKSTGFVQVGATGAGQQQTSTDDALKKAFGL